MKKSIAFIALLGSVALCLLALGFQNVPSPSSVGTSAQILHGGSTPAFGALNLSSDSLSGALPAANGPPIPIHAFCGGTVGTGNAVLLTLQPTMGGTTSGCNQLQSQAVEMPMGVACTLKNLRVKAGAAGAVAGSGVVTIYQNGSPTTITCTLGTTTSCVDTTHSVAYAATDTWETVVQTGQASDTTASVKVVFQCQ